MKLTDAHTITAVVVEYTQGNGRKTLGQATIGDLPQYLIDAIHQFNARPLGELLTDEEK
jgi:hypothetical protein